MISDGPASIRKWGVSAWPISSRSGFTTTATTCGRFWRTCRPGPGPTWVTRSGSRPTERGARARDSYHRPRHAARRGVDRSPARARHGAARGRSDHPALAPEPPVRPRGARREPRHRRHRLCPHARPRGPSEGAPGIGQPRLAKRGVPRVRRLYGDCRVRQEPRGARRARPAAADGDHVRGDGPWRCHRSLIADALTARGIAVLHIVTAGRAEPHELTPFAALEGTCVTYPAATPAGRAERSSR